MITPSRSRPKLVLAIGMVDSVHFARWLNSANGVNAKFTIFPSGPNRRVHPLIRSLISTAPQRFTLSKVMTAVSLPVWLIDRPLAGALRAVFLRSLLQLRRYDVVHFHEMQSGGYPLSRIPAITLSRSRVLYTPYGSDLFWFQNDSKHLSMIRKTLALVDGIFPECERDGQLARKFGFEGKILKTLPASGTFPFEAVEPLAVANRYKITVKGYGGTWGRAIEALRALEKIQHGLVDYEIHLTSVTKDVAEEVSRLQINSKLNLVAHSKFSLTSEEIKTLLLESKYYIALSASDGFPASLFEALMCGSIPIQSDTACIPGSLVEISPESFIATANWSRLGELLLNLETDPKRLQVLSTKLSRWATDQTIGNKDFSKILSNAYCSSSL